MTQEQSFAYRLGRAVRQHWLPLLVLCGVVFIVLISYFGISGSHRLEAANVAATSPAAAPTPDAATPAAPAPAVPSNPLCALMVSGRGNLDAAAQAVANESNPLKKNDAQVAYQQQLRQFNQSIADFVSANSIDGYEGTVSTLDFQNYNTGPGLNLGVTLPCNVTIAFQFVDITNPGWGSMDPQTQTSLSEWKPTLETLAVGSSVRVSGKFFLRYGSTQINLGDSQSTLGLEGTITNIEKE